MVTRGASAGIGEGARLARRTSAAHAAIIVTYVNAENAVGASVRSDELTEDDPA
jgi:hypothetical protein